MKEIGHRDHVRIWHADTAEPDRNPFKGSALGYQPRLYRGCEVEYLETILTTGVGWPLDKPYLWAAIDPGTAWEYPEESAHRIVMVVIKISDYVTARSDYGPPGRSWKHPDDHTAPSITSSSAATNTSCSTGCSRSQDSRPPPVSERPPLTTHF